MPVSSHITEVYDFMRLLYARASDAYSYNTGNKMVKFSEEEIVENIFEKFINKKISLLAPIVRGRKGHYRELFEDLRKKGYLKVRVDGEVKDLVPKMQVDRYKIHDIELVIDRLAITPNMKVRLSQSVQKTMQQGKGLMQVLENETDKVYQFSKTLMCEETGISYDEPSPNTFSFNSPYGACPNCKGLGTVYQVNLDAVIPDYSVSIADGGIIPLGEKRDAWIFKEVEVIARKFKINLSKPIKEIPEKQLNIILYGKETPDQTELGVEAADGSESEFSFGNEESKTAETGPGGVWEGVITMVKRWFNTSSSESIRNWAEDFMRMDTCPSCNGSRLKKESLWFKVAGKKYWAKVRRS